MYNNGLKKKRKKLLQYNDFGNLLLLSAHRKGQKLTPGKKSGVK